MRTYSMTPPARPVLPWIAIPLLVLTVACSDPVDPGPGPDMMGVVVRAGEGLWSGKPGPPHEIHVKADPSDECGIIFSIREETVVRDSRHLNVGDAADQVLHEGVRVAVWHGMVLQSCPGQSTPILVEVLD
jgi:hypothetical protein